MTLLDLGFTQQLEKQAGPFLEQNMIIARVTAVNKNSFTVNNGSREIFAELTGKFLYAADEQEDLPTTGDWVAVMVFDNDELAIIHDILPRTSVLKRKRAGKEVNYQLIAANIDTAFIMQSAAGDFSLNRLERYLVMVNEGGIDAVLLINKCDTIESAVKDKMLHAIEEAHPRCPVYAVSAATGEGMDTLIERMLPGRTYCLLGSSGVGKTTMLNRLAGEDVLTVKPVRDRDGKGTHTTTRRQMILLPSGSLLIDTPGMRELGNFDTASGMSETFRDIEEHAAQCRYSDCTHSHESGCAVMTAVEAGKLPQERLTNYLKMQKEAAHYQRSYHERRQHDKALGKFYKSVMKSKQVKK